MTPDEPMDDDDGDFDVDECCPYCDEPYCDSAECESLANCGERNEECGGGCSLVGSEQCDECPNYNRAVLGKRR